ncbi:UxaA family hydrolase [Histidinibacterium lentulum]|uniref:Hydrolase n=1 Tax=Histidinibacterium lentulum TaxID=2480588 RepID=A0A3N2QLM6_9RHOB|nr:UxaA family hydrolase [Histidinibacterium lentulum]ROT96098.1 hydrolase [Histidinibacterium lentulum]
MPDPRLLLLSPGDTVFVLRGAVEAGETVALEAGAAVMPARLGLGHKIARAAIAKGERIVKYGAPIGRATEDIAAGAHVHVHNVASDYTPTYALAATSEDVAR